MKTRKQKEIEVKEGTAVAEKSNAAILVNFKGLSANEMNSLRGKVYGIQGNVTVMKKRLLKLVLKARGVEMDVKSFEGQVGVVFGKNDLLDISGVVYKFSKEKKDGLKILGGYDFSDKSFVGEVTVKRLGNLPSREVLLSQLVSMIASPIRSFLFVLNEHAKKAESVK